jgi:hypothetical protein
VLHSAVNRAWRGHTLHTMLYDCVCILFGRLCCDLTWSIQHTIGTDMLFRHNAIKMLVIKPCALVTLMSLTYERGFLWCTLIMLIQNQLQRLLKRVALKKGTTLYVISWSALRKTCVEVIKFDRALRRSKITVSLASCHAISCHIKSYHIISSGLIA